MGSQEQVCRILQLSDCTMMYILSYLDATSLFNLSRTCLYFKNIVEDPRLWRYIDARNEPNSTKKVQYVCDRIHDKTSHILMKAGSRYDGLLHQEVLMGWKCLQHLTVLALENQRFDGKTVTLQDFPRTLEELSLKKTYVKNARLFFQGSFGVMMNLRVLILDQCDWLDSNFFMSVAKYENLEILSIIKCMRLHFNIIPYLNVARHGCRNLKIFDCRFSSKYEAVAREVLDNPQRGLLAMYVQSMCSYQLDTGLPLFKFPLQATQTRDVLATNIRDYALNSFKYKTGDIWEELPHSILYQDPYPECSCGWKDKQNDEKEDILPEETSYPMPVDDYIDFNMSPQRFICRKHVNELNKLPKDFKNFFYENQKKFYPDSSDDSDSDDDRDCCMFGMGKSQQMIVLKVREADEQGNLPEPEVIDIRPDRNVIDINFRDAQQAAEGRPRDTEGEPQPSTSRANDTPESSRGVTKRKSEEEDSEGNDGKKRRIEDDHGDRDERPSSSNTGPSEGGIRIAASRQNIENGADHVVHPVANNPSRGADTSNSPDPFRLQSRFDRVATRADRSNSPDFFQQQSRFQALPAERKWRGFSRVALRRKLQVLPKVKMRRLSLRGYRELTDEALTFLQNLNLDLLDVTYTKITKDGIEKFLTLNPNCRIIHTNFCVCKPRIPC